MKLNYKGVENFVIIIRDFDLLEELFGLVRTINDIDFFKDKIKYYDKRGGYGLVFENGDYLGHSDVKWLKSSNTYCDYIYVEDADYLKPEDVVQF